MSSSRKTRRWAVVENGIGRTETKRWFPPAIRAESLPNSPKYTARKGLGAQFGSCARTATIPPQPGGTQLASGTGSLKMQSLNRIPGSRQ
jgi:hypothetical protein